MGSHMFQEMVGNHIFQEIMGSHMFQEIVGNHMFRKQWVVTCFRKYVSYRDNLVGTQPFCLCSYIAICIVG